MERKYIFPDVTNHKRVEGKKPTVVQGSETSGMTLQEVEKVLKILMGEEEEETNETDK